MIFLNKRFIILILKKHKWVVTHPIRNENCPLTSNSEFKPITVTEDEVKNSVVSLSKLDTLVNLLLVLIFILSIFSCFINLLSFFQIFIKSMIKKRSFGHPYRMHISSLSNPNSIDFANQFYFLFLYFFLFFFFSKSILYYLNKVFLI